MSNGVTVRNNPNLHVVNLGLVLVRRRFTERVPPFVQKAAGKKKSRGLLEIGNNNKATTRQAITNDNKR